MDDRKQRRSSLLGPVLLIAIGTVLLLNTLGILEWGIWWNILRLWPVLLIAAGLDLLLGRRSAWGSVLAAILVLAVLGGALWLAAGGDLGRGGLEAVAVGHPLRDAAEADVSIDPGVGVLHVEALAESASLVQGTVHIGRSEELIDDLVTENGTVRLSLRTEGTITGANLGGWNENRVWELGLTPGARLQLQANMGAGEVEMDLAGLDLSEMAVEVGLGRAEIRLPATGRYRARIEGAIGQTVVIIPEGLAVRIQVDAGLAGRTLPAGFEQEEGVYTSPGYDQAENRAEIEVSQAIGLLEIRPVE
jgi:hypothetical protein